MEIDINNLKFIWKHGISRCDIYNGLREAVEAYCNTIDECSNCAIRLIKDGYTKFCCNNCTKSIDDIKRFCQLSGMIACMLVETDTDSVFGEANEISLIFHPV